MRSNWRMPAREGFESRLDPLPILVVTCLRDRSEGRGERTGEEKGGKRRKEGTGIILDEEEASGREDKRASGMAAGGNTGDNCLWGPQIGPNVFVKNKQNKRRGRRREEEKRRRGNEEESKTEK